ncbi:hypothetical protein [Maricaulis sp.]|uniref:hypothetical protein n=1 Tax=Maricaulis sp. TaxID=1486257 RepID=UPI0025DDAEAE|nr:hypothetical protein [Maricaulis sp.]MDF1768317.1 hypothetical protein [Maricaulis sp.]
MVQFLISLIEWFAMVALSSVGLDTSASTECGSAPAPQPAEYREAVMVLGDREPSNWTKISLDPCAQWTPIRDSQELPELLAPPLVYTS